MLPSAELQPSPPRTLGLTAVLASATLVPVFVTVGASAQLAHVGFGLWFTSILLFLGIPWALLRASAFSPGRTLGLTPFFGRGLGLGFGLGAVNLLVVGPLQALVTQLFPKSLVELFDTSAIFEQQSAPELFAIAAAVSVAAPLGEEVFFRGLLQPALTPRLGKWAIVVTAVLFSAMHLDPVGFSARLVLGLLFGFLAHRSGSVWPGIGAHAANNFIFTVAVLLFPEDPGEEPAPRLAALVLAGGVLAMAGALWLVTRKRTWLEAPRRAAPTEGAPVAPVRAFLPWVATGLVGFLLLGLFDWRGVSLNFREAMDRTPGARGHRPAEELRLRQAARRGELPLDDYFRLRGRSR